jgi:hypothetical protein
MLTSDLENPDLATVWRDQTFTFFNGVECPSVEVHRTGNVSHSQERIQLRHRFDANNVALESQGTKSTPGGPGDIQLVLRPIVCRSARADRLALSVTPPASLPAWIRDQGDAGSIATTAKRPATRPFRTVTNQQPALGTFTIDGKTVPSVAEADLDRCSNAPGPSS